MLNSSITGQHSTSSKSKAAGIRRYPGSFEKSWSREILPTVHFEPQGLAEPHEDDGSEHLVRIIRNSRHNRTPRMAFRLASKSGKILWVRKQENEQDSAHIRPIAATAHNDTNGKHFPTSVPNGLLSEAFLAPASIVEQVTPRNHVLDLEIDTRHPSSSIDPKRAAHRSPSSNMSRSLNSQSFKSNKSVRRGNLEELQLDVVSPFAKPKSPSLGDRQRKRIGHNPNESAYQPWDGTQYTPVSYIRSGSFSTPRKKVQGNVLGAGFRYQTKRSMIAHNDAPSPSFDTISNNDTPSISSLDLESQLRETDRKEDILLPLENSENISLEESPLSAIRQPVTPTASVRIRGNENDDATPRKGSPDNCHCNHGTCDMSLQDLQQEEKDKSNEQSIRPHTTDGIRLRTTLTLYRPQKSVTRREFSAIHTTRTAVSESSHGKVQMHMYIPRVQLNSPPPSVARSPIPAKTLQRSRHPTFSARRLAKKLQSQLHKNGNLYSSDTGDEHTATIITYSSNPSDIDIPNAFNNISTGYSKSSNSHLHRMHTRKDSTTSLLKSHPNHVRKSTITRIHQKMLPIDEDTAHPFIRQSILRPLLPRYSPICTDSIV